MELAPGLPFSMLPREVVAADARRWHWALSLSVALHGLALGAVLQRHLMAPDVPALLPLSVQLINAVQAPAAPAPVAIQEPTRHAPIPAPRPAARAPAPLTEVLRNSADSSFSAPVAFDAPPPADIVAAQVPVAPVATTLPPPAPRPAQAADPAALSGYNRALAAAVDRHKRYPRIALMRQWQGTVVLQLNIGVDGQVQEHHLARSSGYDALDQQALEMLREAMPLPAVPAQLAGMSLSVDIPVVFRIAD